MKTVRLTTTCLLALLFCGNVNAATIKVTGGDTFVQIDANALRTLGLDITGVTGADLLSMPGLIGFPINSVEDVPPTTFEFDSDTLFPVSGAIEHTGTISFDNGLTIGNFEIGYDNSRPAGTSGFYVRTTLSADPSDNIPLFDLPEITGTPAGTSVDYGETYLNIDAPLVMSPELATFFGNLGLTGTTVGAVSQVATAEPVPEPGAIALLLLGMLGIVHVVRNRC